MTSKSDSSFEEKFNLDEPLSPHDPHDRTESFKESRRASNPFDDFHEDRQDSDRFDHHENHEDHRESTIDDHDFRKSSTIQKNPDKSSSGSDEDSGIE